jgi:Glycosyl transferase family 2
LAGSRAIDSVEERATRQDLTLSVIVPAFNEMQRLPARLDAILALASGQCEVIFVDDGSTDGTSECLTRAGRSYGARVIRFDRNRGKGAAVRAGVAASRGQMIVFMDADLATDLADLNPLLAALRDSDVAIGSRSMPGAILWHTTRRRSLLGGNFNRLVRRVSGLPMRDTQCGFKGFRAPTAHLLFHLSVIDGFAFDVEVLLLARQLGCSITEVPVHWTEIPGSRIHPARDAVRMATDVARVRNSCRRAARPVATVTLSRNDHEADEVAALVRAHARHADTVMSQNGHVHVLMPNADEAHALSARTRFADALDRPAQLSWLETQQLIALAGSGASEESDRVHRTAVVTGVLADHP